MTRSALMASLLFACCLVGSAHAGLNDRTKKLLQSQALNRPPADSAAKNNAPSNDETVRQGQGTSRGISGAPSGNRGAATGNVPAPKK
jgi:hypothetical protein